MKIFGYPKHHPHESPWDSAPPWALEIGALIIIALENIMSSFDDLKAALDTVTGKVSTVKTDTESLLAKLSAIQSAPPAGMSPEQQAALDAAVTQAKGIADSLGAIDAEVNPAAAPAA